MKIYGPTVRFGLKSKDVKAIIVDYMELAASELKKNGVQSRWLLELEAQEETSPCCSQGRQPIHKRALRVQGQAGFQDCQCSGHEEAERDDQLIR